MARANAKKEPAARGRQRRATSAPARVGKRKVSDDIPDADLSDAARDDSSIETEKNGPYFTRPADMFLDMARRFPEIGKLVKSFKRPLRIATMCSGTEAPLLAMQLLSKACEKLYNKAFEIEHVFSSEIEPFKQGYILRNFPGVKLFRDVRELKQNQAHTAFGALEDVPNTPGCVDLLVAGTSCVDFSTLNNEQKRLTQNGKQGESSQTFFGMYNWVKKARPPMVLLENVCGAPWDDMKEIFQGIGYNAEFLRLDTKKYYLPQTRTRGYLLAVNKSVAHKETVQKWPQKMKDLEYDITGTFEAFLLPDHDHRVQAARKDLVAHQTNGEVAWEKCEARHEKIRQEEQLGSRHASNAITLPDGSWCDWYKGLGERCIDVVDIDMQRCLKIGQDANYKTTLWDLSQNVDRIDPTKVKHGICPCLTPRLLAFMPSRGRQVIGVETLALQGIPIDDLILTRETEADLQSLSGNAMTTTVVGSGIVAALMLLGNKLQLEKRDVKVGSASSSSSSRAPPTKRQRKASTVGTVAGEEQLQPSPLDLGSTGTDNVQALLDAAAKARRCCHCEGLSDSLPAERKVLTCRGCGNMACECCACRPAPEHEYKVDDRPREQPRDFQRRLERALPMVVQVSGLERETLCSQKPADVEDLTWTAWLEKVLSLQDLPFRLVEVVREAFWKGRYEDSAQQFSLVMTMTEKDVQWCLTAKLPEKTSSLHHVLKLPIAEMKVHSSAGSLTDGEWQFRLPGSDEVQVSISGDQPLVPAYEATWGIEVPAIKDMQRWSGLSVEVPENEFLQNAIGGKYRLLPKCAAALGSLHVREDPDKEPMYFFWESHAVGHEKDGYVFARDWRKLALDEVSRRSQLCGLPPGWKKASTEGKESVTATSSNRWTLLPMKLTAAKSELSSLAALPASPTVDLSQDNPRQMQAILLAEVPVADVLKGRASAGCETVWSSKAWAGLTLTGLCANSAVTAQAKQDLGFLLPRLDVPTCLQSWQSVDGGQALIQRAAKGESCCPECVPVPPRLQWVKEATTKAFRAVEDPYEAAAYEQSLKLRPQAFALEARADSEVGRLRVAIGVASIVTRAFAAFPRQLQAEADSVQLQWRLLPEVEPPSEPKPFSLRSNLQDTQADQPPGFTALGRSLRREQLRSLHWMLAQENTKEPFIECEVADETLGALGWRLEARATVPQMVRGGVLADAVGYGKTAITLGLIDMAKKTKPKLPANLSGKAIPVKATLIIVPKTLMNQWPKELEKFLGDKYSYTILYNLGDVAKLTIEEVQSYDIIFACVGLFRTDKYYDRLGEFAVTHAMPSKPGRHFNEVHEEAMKNLEGFAEALTTSGVGAMEARRLQKAVALAQEREIVASKKHAYNAPLKGRREAPKNSKDSTVARLRRLLVTISGKQPKKAPKSSTPARRRLLITSSGKQHKSSKKVVGKISKAKPAAKQPRLPISKDPYGVDAAASEDWKQLRVPLEMYCFQRKVVDEYTYLEGKAVTAIQALKAQNIWVLSGTPPVDTFDDVRSIAAHLGLHLGSTEIGKITTKAKSELSKSEMLNMFLEPRSANWYANRQRAAQEFLDRFVRQNDAEISEIPYAEQEIDVMLPAAERAVYLELSCHLTALDLRSAKKSKKGVSERELRLRRALAGSKDAEEALLKCCSYFDQSETQGPLKTPEAAKGAIKKRRREAMTLCADEVEKRLGAAMCINQEVQRWLNEYPELANDYSQKSSRPMWIKDKACQMHLQHWLDEVEKGVGDGAANLAMCKMVKRVQKTVRENKNGLKWRSVYEEHNEDGEPSAKRRKAARAGRFPMEVPKDAAERCKVFYSLLWEIRKIACELRGFHKELVGRTRAMRFFEQVADVCQPDSKAIQLSTRTRSVQRAESRLLSCCGHIIHESDVHGALDQQSCPVKSCSAEVKENQIINVAALASSCAAATRKDYSASSKYGAKFSKLLDIVTSVPQTDRILVFAQFAELLDKVALILNQAKIKVLRIKGTAHQQSKAMSIFQEEELRASSPRVLLLEMHNESAAGANLTTANHAIFVHPLHVDSLQKYKACETQALGRIRRYGQQKLVKHYRLLVSDSVDREIYNRRKEEITAERSR
eukprot:TRINITY_DN17471_c0_g2_i1.p1 TRINITY_DN17471_c0_g2~~TRINITY_DN17471_c0_g2_i1.p1  ORF type:complete len:2091 (-),score=518.39 TRINITY_DN17471_c0_g2_i1:228-6500(-)